MSDSPWLQGALGSALWDPKGALGASTRGASGDLPRSIPLGPHLPRPRFLTYPLTTRPLIIFQICDFLLAHSERYEFFVDDDRPFADHVRVMRENGELCSPAPPAPPPHLRR